MLSVIIAGRILKCGDDFIAGAKKKRGELKHTVHTEQKLSEINGRLDHSPEKSLGYLAQEARVSDFEFMLFPNIIIYYLVCEATGTAATPGLLCQARVIVKMIVEKQMECRLARETEVLGENLPQHHFCPS
jgi:hypothetical protein